MLVLIQLDSEEAVALEFGRPLIPVGTVEERLRFILARYAERRDELWALPVHAVTPLLADRLEQAGSDPEELHPIIDMLARIGVLTINEQPRCAELVANRLRFHPDLRVRLVSIRCLGCMGLPDYIDVVAPFLKDPDRRVRREAIYGLSLFGDPQVLPLIHAAAQADPALRPAYLDASDILAALSRHDIDAFVRAALPTDLYEVLISWLVLAKKPLMNELERPTNSAEIRMRLLRILSLGRVRDAKVQMKRIARNPREAESLRLEAIRGLGRCQIKTSVEELVTMLQTASDSYAREIIIALGRIGLWPAFDPLLAMWPVKEGVYQPLLREALRRLAQHDADYMVEHLKTNADLPIIAVYFIDENFRLETDFRRALVVPFLEARHPEAQRDALLTFAYLGEAEEADLLRNVAEGDGPPENRLIAGWGFERLLGRHPSYGPKDDE